MKARCPFVVHQCVVKAEIRWRQAAFVCADRILQRKARGARLRYQPRLDGSPCRQEPPRDQGLYLGKVRRRRIERLQPLDPPFHHRDIFGKREAGFRPHRQRRARARVDRQDEIDRGIDMRFRHFRRGELAARYKPEEPCVLRSIAGERLWKVANAARPRMGDEIPLGAQPVARVADIAEVALEHQRDATIGVQTEHLVVAAAG
jgi:hypothetical protein